MHFKLVILSPVLNIILMFKIHKDLSVDFTQPLFLNVVFCTFF